MKKLGLLICLLSALLVIFLFYSTCKAGTIEELYAIAEKYMENPIEMEDHGDHICVYVLNTEKTDVIAIDIRTLDLKICLYFYEKIDGVMTLKWTNPGIEAEQKKAKQKNQV